MTTVKFDGEDEIFTDFYRCENCGFNLVMRDFKYCPNCGEEIQWDQSELQSVTIHP